MASFDEYYKNGLIDKVLTSNVIYQTPELLSREYYVSVDLSKYIALLIDSINSVDRPVIVAYLCLTTILFVFINFVVDILYTIIDPRIKLR